MAGAYYSKRYGYNDNWLGPPPKSYRNRSGSTFNAFLRAAAQAVKAAERDRRANERHQLSLAREAIRLNRAIERENVRTAKAQQKEAAKRYLEERLGEVDELNRDVESRLSDLDGVLSHTLLVDDTISFNDLKKTPPFPPFDSAHYKSMEPIRPAISRFVSKVNRPHKFFMFFGFVKNAYQSKLAAAQKEFDVAMRDYEKSLAQHQDKVAGLYKQYLSKKAAYLESAIEHAKQINSFEELYRSGSSEGIKDYCSMVLDRSEYPEGIDLDFDVEFDQGTKITKVLCTLPNIEVIPAVASYGYVKSRDEVTEKPRKQSELTKLYRKFICMIAIRTVHELFEADQGHFLSAVEFVGTVEALDNSTGHVGTTDVIHLRTDKETFLRINLNGIDPQECVLGLGGSIK
jgi:restriction system protein